jgi:hypothetical protein
VQAGRLVEQGQGQGGHLPAVGLVPGVAAGEVEHRAAARRRRAGRRRGGVGEPRQGLEDHALAQRPGREDQLAQAERLHHQGGHLGGGDDGAGPQVVQLRQPGAVAGRGAGQVAGHHVEGVPGEDRRGLAVDAGEAERMRRRRRAGQRPRHLAEVPERLGGPADHVPSSFPEPVGERAEQREGVDAQGDQVLGADRVGADEAAGEARRAERERLGQLGALALAGGHLQAAPADVDHQQPAGRERRPAPRGQVGEARLLHTRQDADGHPGRRPYPIEHVQAVAGLPDRRGREADHRARAQAVGHRPHAADAGDQPFDRLLGQGHRREGRVGEPQGVALAPDHREGAVGATVDHHQVDGVGPDVERGQSHRGQRRSSASTGGWGSRARRAASAATASATAARTRATSANRETVIA